jgi:hypothetical protein
LEDNYASKGYYIVQNAYIGLKIYDNKTVMYDPDMEYVAVDDEQISVQVYDATASSWKNLQLGNAYLRVDAHNATASVITRVCDNAIGRLEVTYVIRAGELMKVNIVFTNLLQLATQFRIVQNLSGVHGSNATYETTDGPSRKLDVTASTTFIAPHFTVETSDKPVLNVNLRDLGHEAKDKWVSDILRNVTLNACASGVEAKLILGNFSLGWKQTLTIDPSYTTSPYVFSGNSDTYVEKADVYSSGQLLYTTYQNYNTATSLKFGKHKEDTGPDEYTQYTYRTYLRFPILLPVGATVTSAYLNVSAFTGGPNYDFTTYIRTLDKDDCSAFTDSASTIWGYGVMTNTTSWAISGSWTGGKCYQKETTQNVKDFMTRANYALGNYIGLRLDEGSATYDANHYRQIYSYNYKGAEYAPRLKITFTYNYDDTLVQPIYNWGFEDNTNWTITSGSNTLNSTIYMQGQKSWYVTGSSTQNDVYLEQTLRSSVINSLKNRASNQKRGVCFSFYYKPDGVNSNDPSKGEKNKAYAWIQWKINGNWQTGVPGTVIKPDNASKWWHPIVNVQLPPETQEVRVRIYGNPYGGEVFKGWIDCAILSVYYYSNTTLAYGTAGLTTNIYYSNVIQNPEWGGFVSLGTSIAARSTDNSYSVGKLGNLKAELLPNDGSKTSQAARLVILHASQGNKRNININPSTTQDAINTGLDNVETTTGIAIGLVGTIAGAATTGGTSIVVEIAFTVGGIAQAFYRLPRVNLDHPLAEGGTDYAAWETFDYSGSLGILSDRFEWADGDYYFDWRFRSDMDNVFAIKISATVDWYHWNVDSWEYYSQTPLSYIISIALY